jgi:hypothetical protein
MFSDALYNELADTGRESLQSHLDNCPMCASEYANMVAVLEKMDSRKRPEITEEYWESYWHRLEERIDKKSGKIKDKIGFEGLWKWTEHFDFKRGRVFYPVSAVLLIVLGIFIGKFMYSPGGRGERPAPAPNRIDAAAFQHFDNLRPLLVECSNYTGAAGSGAAFATITIEEETLKKLVFRHYLLKKAVSHTDNLFLKQLIDELELVLLEISNSNGQKKKAIRAVRDILKDSDILFKMNVYMKRRTAVKI